MCFKLTIESKAVVKVSRVPLKVTFNTISFNFSDSLKKQNAQRQTNKQKTETKKHISFDNNLGLLLEQDELQRQLYLLLR